MSDIYAFRRKSAANVKSYGKSRQTPKFTDPCELREFVIFV